MKTRFSHAATFGAASGIAVIIFFLIIYLANLPEGLTNVSYIILIAIHCIGVKKWRDQNGGFLTFGATYVHLIIQSTVYGIMMGIWMYIFTAYVAPGFFDSKLMEIQAQMEAQNQPQEAIDMAMKWSRWVFQPWVMTLFALLGIIIYALIDLIIAAIMKKDPPSEQFMPPGQFPNVPPPPRFPEMGQNNPYQQNPPQNFPPQQ